MTVRYPLSSIESRSVRFGMVAADTGSSRLVYAMVFTLILIGVVLLVLAVVVFRRTRVDPDVLAPLERMGSRRWRKGDPESRRALLDAVRPAGAIGPSPTGSADDPAGLPPPVIEPGSEASHDETFVAGPEGIEPVAHDQVTVPLDAAEVADVSLADSGAAEASDTTRSVTADPAPIAAEEPSDAVAAADVVPVQEAVSTDGAAVTSDDAGDAPDGAVADADEASPRGDAPAAPGAGDAAPTSGSDDEGAPTDEGVDAPPEPVGPVDGSVGGQ